MKSILLSVKPKWCELIASGKKTIEVRKTRPKIDTPFKVYIYETKTGYVSKSKENDGLIPIKYSTGKVIGEYICDAILPISIKYSDPKSKVALREFPYTCLTDKDIMNYLGNGKTGYGWHISDLKIYDKPKELNEFIRICSEWEKEDLTNKCLKCNHYFRSYSECFAGCDCDGELSIKRPPQSWCYVEEGGKET